MKKYILILLLFLSCLTFAFEKNVTAKTNTITFSNKQVMKTWFYPYRDPAGKVAPNAIRSLQGFTINAKKDIYVSYATDDKTTYGYIYHYYSTGKLVKESTRLVIGHGQAISNYKGSIYVVADISGKKNYQMYKIDEKTLRVKQSWILPSNIHPNVLYMHNEREASVVSKVTEGYHINRITLTGKQAVLDTKKRIVVKGLVGTTVKKPVQGFTYEKGLYYILSDGQYGVVDAKGNLKRIALQTKREPEGIGFVNGKMVMAFNNLNELFKQK